MMRSLLIALLALLIASPAIAQDPVNVTANASDPVNITADKFVMDEENNLATFTGGVVVKRRTLTVWAPKVVVDYGEGGPSDIKSFVASGGVRIKTTDQDVTGDRAIYDPRTEKLRVTGNVMVVNASSTVGSGDMIVDLKTDTTTFTGGGKNGRVTGVFTPQ
jgi:lipopolysaccharide export system protein LptA